MHCYYAKDCGTLCKFRHDDPVVLEILVLTNVIPSNSL